MDTNGEMYLPYTSGGVRTIGDLWDPQTYKPLGLNLFGNTTKLKLPSGKGEEEEEEGKFQLLSRSATIGKSYEEYRDVRSFEDSSNLLKLEAEVGVDALAGLISANVGVNFEIGNNNSMSQKEIRLFISRQNNIVDLMDRSPPNDDHFRNAFDPHIIQLFGTEEGKDWLNSLYVVNRVSFGGNLMGGMKLSQLNTGNQYGLGFNIRAAADIKVAKLTVSLNVSVSENVEKKNYEASFSVNSIPAIPPPFPGNMEDFEVEAEEDAAGIANMGKRFDKQLQGELHFQKWGGSSDIIGIPIKFRLVPLSSVLTLEDLGTGCGNDDDPTDEAGNDLGDGNDEPNPPTLGLTRALNTEEFLDYLGQLTDWSTRKDFLKSRILLEKPTTHKMLSESTHLLTKELVQFEAELEYKSGLKREEILEDYHVYKGLLKKGSSSSGEELWDKMYKQLVEFSGEWSIKIYNAVEDFKRKANDELIAVNIWEEEDSEESDFAERSALVFFTNRTELEAWLGTSRLVKFLYTARVGVPAKGISQQLYRLSLDLGKLFIQPGIAYPSLYNPSQPNIAPDAETPYTQFTIHSDRETLEFSSSAEGVERTNFVISVIEACTGVASDNETLTYPLRLHGRLHLFTAYLEQLGLRLDVNAKEDVIPLITFLQDMFQSRLLICQNRDATMNEMKEEGGGWKFVVTTDGIRSIYDVIHTLRIFQPGDDNALPPTIEYKLISGLFFDTEPQLDSPLLFLSNGGELKAVCLDHLDLLILLERMESGELATLTDILGLKNMNKYPIAPNGRVEFAEKVRLSFLKMTEDVYNDAEGIAYTTNDNTALQITPYSNEDRHIQAVLEIFTALIMSKVGGPVPFATAIARYLILEKEEDFIDGLVGWDRDQRIFKADTDWNALGLKLDSEYKTTSPLCKEYENLLENFQAWLLYNPYAKEEEAVDPVQPTTLDQTGSTKQEDDDEKLTDEKIFGEVKSALDKIGAVDVLKEIEEIYELRMHLKAKVELYYGIISPELETTKAKDTSVLGLIILRDVAFVIADSGALPVHKLHDWAAQFMTSLESRPVLLRFSTAYTSLQNCSSRKAYYQIAKELAQLSQLYYPLQMGLQRLSSTKDWISLTRILQEISETFAETDLFHIWRNPKFQHLIKNNISNKLVQGDILDEDNNVPGYIPEEMKQLLYRVREGGNDQEVDVEYKWKDVSQMVETLKILYVSRFLPTEFPSILLDNVLGDVNKVKDSLTAVGALYHWNEEDQLFEEPWDLVSLKGAVDALLKKPMIGGSKGLGKGTTLLPLESAKPISTTIQSSPSLIQRSTDKETAMEIANHIRNVSLPKIRKSLLQEQNPGLSSATEFLNHWDRDKAYEFLIIRMCDLVDSETFLIQGLPALAQSLDQICSEACKDFCREVEKLEGWSPTELGVGAAIHKESLALAKISIQERTLTPMELLVELCKVNDLCPQVLPTFKKPLASIMTQLALSGQSIPVSFSALEGFFVEDWNQSLLAHFNDLRVFVLTSLYSDTKRNMELLSTLFGPTTSSLREVIVDTAGLLLRLVFLDKTYKDKVGEGVDAILLVQTRPVCRTEFEALPFSSQSDQKLTTLLLASSNLIFIPDSLKKPEFLSLLEMSTFHISRLQPSSTKPHLTFIQNKDAEPNLEYLQEVVKKLGEVSNKRSTLLKISTQGEIMASQLDTDLTNETLLFPYRDKSQSQDISHLMDHLIRTVCEEKGRIPLLGEWASGFQQTWSTLNHLSFPANNPTKMEAEYDFRQDIFKLRSDIDAAFVHHSEDFEGLITDCIFNILNFDEGSSKSSRQDLKRILYFTMESRVEMVPKRCTLEDDQPCQLCLEVQKEEISLVQKWSSPVDQRRLTASIEDYVSTRARHYLGVGRQMYAASEVKEDLVELLEPAEKRVCGNKWKLGGRKQTLGNYSTVKQGLSTKRFVVSCWRRMQYEIEDVFPDNLIQIERNQSPRDLGQFLKCERQAYEQVYEGIARPAGRLSEGLSWKDVALLRQKLMHLGKSMVSSHGASMFEDGMVDGIRSEVEGVLDQLESYRGRRLRPNFRLEVMFFVIQDLFYWVEQQELKWSERWDPVKQI